MLKLPRHLLLTLLALPFAAQADYDKRYQSCLDANGPINNGSVAACADEVSAAVKQEMNRVYQQLFLKLEQIAAEDARQLEAAQKAWLVYRNSQCELQGRHVGSPMYHYCPMQMNIRRLDELKLLLDNGG